MCSGFSISYELGEATMFLAVGFVPTLFVLELVYRMGKAIGRGGEVPSLA
jgi:hypothetical protein